MALRNLYFADVPLRNCSLIQLGIAIFDLEQYKCGQKASIMSFSHDYAENKD